MKIFSNAPHLTRVGITGKQIEGLLSKQRKKLGDLSEYLQTYADER